MYWFRSFLAVLVVSVPLFVSAQPAAGNPVKQPRILILVDGSSSMLQPWGGGLSRFNIAGKIVEKLIDSVYSVNDQVEFGLRVYGHMSPAQDNNCYDTRREVQFSKNNYTQMSLRMASLQPRGVSPIAYSLRQAAENDMPDERDYSYSVILITDGGESCGGDICAVVKTLLDRKIFFKPYILSLVDYAPLRQQYDCLGQYLQVAKNGDIPVAVGTIVEAYRKSLVLAKAADKTVRTNIPVPVPSVLHIPAPKITLPAGDPEPTRPVPPPAPAITRTELQAMPLLARLRATPLRPGNEPVFRRRRIPAMPAVQPEPEPISRQQFIALRPVTRAMQQKALALSPAPVARPRRIPRMPAVQAEPEPVVRTELASLRPRTASLSPRPLNFSSPRTPRPRRIPRMPAIRPEPDPVAAQPTPAPRPPAPARPTANPRPRPSTSTDPAKPTEAEYTATTEPARESSLEIYFTDGHGTFYSTSPEMLAKDPRTGATLKKFYRTVDFTGAPDAQLLPPGTYNILVAGRSNLIAKNVMLGPNEKKKVYIKVSKSTIRFRYEGNPKRPVSEFEAQLGKLFQPGPVIRQRCTAELEYEPASYRIEINTIPVTRFSLDVEFNTSYDVTISEPGFVQFTNTSPVGKVGLFRPVNDAFLRFLNINIVGRLEEQKMQLQPGTYEAHWIKNPNQPYATETIVRFVIRSNEVTNVELQ